MSTDFIFEDSNFAEQYDTPVLSSLIKDLFKGNKSFSESDANGNRKLIHTNPPIIKFKEGKPSIRDAVFWLIPEKLTGFKKEEVTESTRFQLSTFINFKLGARDNTLGRRIFGEFIKDPDRVVDIMDRHIDMLLRTDGVTVDKKALEILLSEMKDSVIRISTEESEHVGSLEQQSKGSYGRLLEKKKYSKLLSGILISIIIGNLYEVGDYKLTYGLKSSWLLPIWIKAENSELYPYVEPQSSAYLAAKDSYICALGSFCAKEYDKSFGILERTVSRLRKDSRVKGESREKSDLIYLYAIHLLNGYGCSPDTSEAIHQLLRCVSVYPNGKAHYALACCYDGTYDPSLSDPLSYAQHLKQAAGLDHIQAKLDLAKKYMTDKEFSDGVPDRWEQAQKLLNGIKKECCSKSQHSSLYYLLGMAYEHNNDPDRARIAYERSYDLGNRDAYRKIRYRKKSSNTQKQLRLNDAYAEVCFLTNSLSSPAAAAFIRSLDTSSAVYTTDTSLPSHSAIRLPNNRAFIEEMGITDDGYISTKGRRHVVLFFSEDGEKNLFDTLEILDLLYNTVIEKQEGLRYEIIDSFEIFLKCDYDHASIFIDANLNDMLENTYFKVHICDPNRDCAHQLLYNTPLFIPALKNTSPRDKCNIIIFGNSEFTQVLSKEIVALGYMGESYPVTLNILGKDADKARARFFADKPGLYKQAIQHSIRCIIPEFHEFDVYTMTPDTLSGGVLAKGNYFVIDVGSDQENIRFAITLRRELIKSVTDMDRVPLIAVRCSDMRTAHLADRAPLIYRAQGDHFSNKYDLRFFGMWDTMYSYTNLITDNTPMERAGYIHSGYDEEYFKVNKRSVYNDFYSYQYNRDSSLVTAIGLRYRLFGAGLYTDISFCEEQDRALAPAYDLWLEKGDNLDKAADIEQSRWNSFMLSRGWESACLEQVRTYIKQSPDRQHKHLLAKLHPFICNWEDFDENDRDTILFNLQKEFGKDNIKNPRNTTLKSIRDTSGILLRGNGDILDED